MKALLEAVAASVPESGYDKWQRQLHYLPDRDITCATDGRRMVCIAGRHCDGDAEPRNARRFAAVMDVAFAPAGIAAVCDLAEWCGPVEESKRVNCDLCGGDGVHECLACEDAHTCGSCEGSGEVWTSPDVRPGIIAGLMIDRNRLASLLGSFSGGCIVATGRDMIRAANHGEWWVYLARLDLNDKSEKHPVFSALTPVP